MATKKDETQDQEAPESEVETVEEVPYESEGARYMRVRAEAKAQAAVTMAEEAKAAKAAKDKRLKRSVDKAQADFQKRALEIEKQINAKEED